MLQVKQHLERSLKTEVLCSKVPGVMEKNTAKGTWDRNAGVGAAVLNGMVREGFMEVSIRRR